jgi:hypothetical protein
MRWPEAAVRQSRKKDVARRKTCDVERIAEQHPRNKIEAAHCA